MLSKLDSTPMIPAWIIDAIKEAERLKKEQEENERPRPSIPLEEAEEDDEQPELGDDYLQVL